MKENKGFAQFIKDTAKYPECSFHDASDYLSTCRWQSSSPPLSARLPCEPGCLHQLS
jgi:hypothetical protein